MELRRYLQAILRHWKLVAFVMLATMTLTTYLASKQSSVFESNGTYVVRPSSTSEDQADAIDVLGRGPELISTYARVARSDIIRDRARAVLAEEDLSTSGLRVRSEVLPGTNIIQIGASGPDPDRVAAYADAVGRETASYLEETGEVFVLQLLDTPDVPSASEGSTKVVTIAIGVIFGALAGSVLAFAAEYANEKPQQDSMNIRDVMTGAYTDDYFRLRLRQEMSRCDIPSDLRSRPPTPRKSRGKGKAKKRQPEKPRPTFTVGIVHVHAGDPSQNGAGPVPEALDLRDAARTLQAQLRFEDVVAYLGDNRFAVLCPDLSRTRVDQLLVQWNRHLRTIDSEPDGSMYGTVGTCQCDALGLSGDETAMKDAYAV